MKINIIPEKLICQVCNKAFNKIDCVTRHVKVKHNIKPVEYYDKYFKLENDGMCRLCGKSTKYWNLYHGYREFCSIGCFWKWKHSIEETKEKRKTTLKALYGTEEYFKSEDFKEKTIDTNMKLYGIANAGGSEKVIEKIKNTKQIKYNNPNYNGSDIKEHNTLEKYKAYDTGLTILSYSKKIFKCICNTCKSKVDITYSMMNNRFFNYKTVICPICNPTDAGISKEEKDVLTEVKKIYNGTIIENDRTVLKPYELDIYLPELKIGIEFNGTYWHGLENVKSHDLIKQKICKEKNIKLIIVTENHWLRDRVSVIENIKQMIYYET